MNYSLINLTKVGLFLTAASSLFLTAKPSQAVITSFASNEFRTNSGTVVSGAPADGSVDNIGFGNVFADTGNSDGYLLLGTTLPNNSTNPPTNASPSSGTHESYSNSTFTISSSTENVSLKFDWAFFNGANVTATNPLSDFFQVGIIPDGFTDYGNDFQPLFTVNAPDFGSALNKTVVATGFAPGNYRVAVSLNEQTGSGGYNTAAGFDNITVSVPFEFSPAQGLLAVGGFWGISAFLKRRKAAAMLNSNLAS
jgi:hypothetical protein